MNNFTNVYELSFMQHGDERGDLIVVEGNKDVPFDIKRVFYICGSDSTVVRGVHANKKSQFVLINVAGTSKVKVKDGMGNEKVFLLNRPCMGIYIPQMVWKEMYDFSADSVLLCLASEHYEQEEYIRDYEEYVRIMRDDNCEK